MRIPFPRSIDNSDPPQEVVPFEEWDTQRRKKEERADKARKKAKKAEEERRREERRQARARARAGGGKNADGGDDDDDSEDELTEKEIAALRGYKKTSDGRTTSYFTREQTERERELIGSIAPRRIDESPSPTSNPAAAADPSSSPGGGAGAGGSSGPSAWNASGTTWEEKDATEWCTRTLEDCLLGTPPSSHRSEASGTTYVAAVRGVSDVKGDASVAISGGKKRYIYDYHATVDYEISESGGGGDVVVASGSLRLPEVHSANTSSAGAVEEELEVEVLAWKRAPSSSPPRDDNSGGIAAGRVKDCVECRKVLVADVRKSVLGFVEKFNENF